MNVHAVIAATAHTLSRHGLQSDVSAPDADVAVLEVSFGLEHHIVELVDAVGDVTARQGRRNHTGPDVDWLEPSASIDGPEAIAEFIGTWINSLTFASSLSADLERAIESATD